MPIPRHHRLSRRLFLSDYGKGALAVAVLGTAVVSCSSDSTTGSQAETTAGAADDTSPATTAVADAAGDDNGGSVAEELQWERVDFGFVSAYVLARGNEVAIVDTGTSGNSAKIEEALSAIGFGWADVDHVIVTHAHGDHIGGLDQVLTSAADAIGYAGAGDVEGLSAPRDLVSVSDGDEVFGLNVIGTPGHTPGHISVLDPDSGLFVAGDAMVTSGGRLAGPVAEFSSDIDLAEESVKMLDGEAIKTILVGHGDPITGDAGSQLADLAASL